MNISEISNHWDSHIRDIKSWNISLDITFWVYIPFCAQRCSFCNCFVKKWDKNVLDDFLDIFEQQCKTFTEIFSHYTFKKIVIAGGTSSSLWADRTHRLFSLIFQYFSFSENVKIIYLTDHLFTNKKILQVIDTFPGKKIMSLGVQSTDQSVLDAISRKQTIEQLDNLIWDIKDLNFYLALDIVTGLPKDTIDTFRQTLYDVKRFDPDFISLYRLEVSEYTNLKKQGYLLDAEIKTSIHQSFFLFDSFFKDTHADHVKIVRWFENHSFVMHQYKKENQDFKDFSNLWRQEGSFLNLWYGDTSSIFWEIEYDFIPWDRSQNIDVYWNIDTYSAKHTTIVHSLRKLFYTYFSYDYIPTDMFNIYSLEYTRNILKPDIDFLIRHKKLSLDSWMYVLHFQSPLEILFYQKLMWNKFSSKNM